MCVHLCILVLVLDVLEDGMIDGWWMTALIMSDDDRMMSNDV